MGWVTEVVAVAAILRCKVSGFVIFLGVSLGVTWNPIERAAESNSAKRTSRSSNEAAKTRGWRVMAEDLGRAKNPVQSRPGAELLASIGSGYALIEAWECT